MNKTGGKYGGGYKSMSIVELEAEIEKLSKWIENNPIASLKPKPRQKLQRLKAEHVHRVSKYRQRKIKLVQGGSPGLGRNR